jgi:hypothetical protein
LRLLKREPFVPIRVHTSDGTWHDIKHPEMASVTRSALVIWIGPDYNGIRDDWVWCSWLHVTKVEDIRRLRRLSQAGRRRAG